MQQQHTVVHFWCTHDGHRDFNEMAVKRQKAGSKDHPSLTHIKPES